MSVQQRLCVSPVLSRDSFMRETALHTIGAPAYGWCAAFLKNPSSSCISVYTRKNGHLRALFARICGTHAAGLPFPRLCGAGRARVSRGSSAFRCFRSTRRKAFLCNSCVSRFSSLCAVNRSLPRRYPEKPLPPALPRRKVSALLYSLTCDIYSGPVWG